MTSDNFPATEEPDPDYAVILVGGATIREGDIQLNYQDTPGLICDDDFDLADGNVICRMAGFPLVTTAFCC